MTIHEEKYKGYKIRIVFDDYPRNPFEEWDFPKGLAMVHNDRNIISILDGDLSCTEFSNMLKGGEDYFSEYFGEDVWTKKHEDGFWRFYIERYDDDGGEELLYVCKKPGLCESEAWEDICNYHSYPVPEDFHYLPIYKFEHGDVCYNTTGYSCPWDSGQFGWIYISKEDAKNDYFKDDEAVIQAMKNYVDLWSQWASGEVYGFIIEESVSCTCGEHTEWEEVESCWGFYGDYEGKGGCLVEAKSTVDYLAKEGSDVKDS